MYFSPFNLESYTQETWTALQYDFENKGHAPGIDG